MSPIQYNAPKIQMALFNAFPSTKPLKQLHLNSLIILKLIILAITAQDYPPISANCKRTANVNVTVTRVLEQFPGFGWDALKAQPRSFVFKISYDKCFNHYSGFGGYNHEFLLVPDQLLLNSPRNKWKNYEKDVVSTEELVETPSLIRFVSENTNTYKSPIKSTLSENVERWKNAFRKHRGVVHRRQLVIERFEAILRTELELTANFTRMMNAILDQQERENEISAMKKLAELVKEFGTHYTTSAVYGGNAFIDSYGPKKTEEDSTKVEFIGGNRTGVRPATQEWVDSTAENAEIVSLTGDFVFSLLRSRAEFTKYHADIRNKVHSKFFYYILNYHTDSIRSGCTGFSAANFNGKANKDDGSCIPGKASKALCLKPHFLLIVVNIIYYYDQMVCT